jgi:hypothetical protein
VQRFPLITSCKRSSCARLILCRWQRRCLLRIPLVAHAGAPHQVGSRPTWSLPRVGKQAQCGLSRVPGPAATLTCDTRTFPFLRQRGCCSHLAYAQLAEQAMLT